jgi:hypothetical protein
VTFAQNSTLTKLFRILTELKNGFEMKRKKVKVVYKPLNTSFKVLFKTSFFQNLFCGISSGTIRAKCLGQNTNPCPDKAGIV